METRIFYYYLNIDKEDEAEEYRLLCDKLRGQGLTLFDSISSQHGKWYKDTIKPLHGQTITLETECLFSNQWNTAKTETSENGLRVFDWAEGIYQNRDIKEGQYLEQTKEMDQVRKDTVACGYCGKQTKAYKHSKDYNAKDQGFCNKCLDSPYLKESELHLLRLKPVFGKSFPKRKLLTQEEQKTILPQYIIAQTKQKTAKAKKVRANLIADYQKTKARKQEEFDGFLWLLDNGQTIDNVIYYDHRQLFSFGWQKPVDATVRDELVKLLIEFPFAFEIQVEGQDRIRSTKK